jgi:hypothetical protein
MKRCYKCGNSYDGWSCPTCSIQEKLKKELKKTTKELHEISQKSSLEEWWGEYKKEFKEYKEREWEEQKRRREKEAFLEEYQRESDYALAEERRIQAEAWRLQADAKADNSYELYKAGLYEEAIKLCLETISHQDPGNIKLYRFAAWSFEALGQKEIARDLLKKQISLLKIEEYKNSLQNILRTLEDILEIEDNKDLLQTFLDVSKEFPRSAQLLDELVKRSLYDVAYNLLKSWDLERCSDIELLAYGIELSHKILGEADTGKLEIHLKNMAYTERYAIFNILKNLKDKETFSDNTKKILRKKIRERYEEWEADINRSFREIASQEAKETAKAKSMPAVLGWIVGIIILIMLWNPIGWFTALLVAIVAGIFVRHLIRLNIQRNKEAKLIESMREKEEETLHNALLS